MDYLNNIIGGHFTGGYAWINEVYTTLPIILYVMMALVGGAGIVYSIILGINLAKADSEDARKKAQNRLRNTIVGVAVLIILILIINVLLPFALKGFLTRPGFFEKK